MATIVNDAPAASTLSWLQRHERIVIVFLVLLSGSWGLNHFLNNQAAKADARATAAEQAAAVAQSTVASNAAATAQAVAQYQNMVQSLTAQNAALAASLAARQSAVVVQQGKDAQLPPSDLATRLQALGQAPAGSVTVTATGLALTQPAAVDITQQLELVDPLQANLKDETTIAGNLQTELAKADAVVTDQATQITSMGVAKVADDNACKAEVTAVKADARKSKLHFFKLGFITGNVTGFIAGLYAGHLGL